MCLTFYRTLLLILFAMIISPSFFTKAPDLTGFQAIAKEATANIMHATCLIFICKKNNNLCFKHVVIIKSYSYQRFSYRCQFVSCDSLYVVCDWLKDDSTRFNSF